MEEPRYLFEPRSMLGDDISILTGGVEEPRYLFEPGSDRLVKNTSHSL